MEFLRIICLSNIAMLNVFVYYILPIFYPVILQYSSCKHLFSTMWILIKLLRSESTVFSYRVDPGSDEHGLNDFWEL